MRPVLALPLLVSCVIPEVDLREPPGPDDPPPVVDPDDPDVAPPGAPPFLDGEAIAAINDALDAELGSSPFTWGAHVIDLENGQIVYTWHADRPLKPASNTKLLTTAAAMDLLGPEYRAEVELWARAEPSGPQLEGDLVVRGLHDGSWSSFVHRTADPPADRLAAAVRRLGVTRVRGAVRARGEFVYEPHRFGTFDAAMHRARAATATRDALGRAGVVVDGAATTDATNDAPADHVRLRAWRGTTFAGLAAPINKISHNELADLMARHVGAEIAGQSTYAAFEVAVLSWLADRELPSDGVRLRDGSGLSHDNRVTARLIAELFAAVDKTALGPDFVRSLAIGAVDGTLAGRLDSPDTAGRFFGKTGTLRDTIATSGVLHNRHDGHRYAIALIANDVHTASAARLSQDTIVRILARDWRGRGARPSPPVARALLTRWDRAQLTWRADPSATEIEVWLSDDAMTWARERAVRVDGQALTLRGLTAAPLHVRLIAVNAGGRSEPSDVLTVRGGDGPRLLVVDGNDRWDGQSENPLGAGHDFVARVAAELPRARVASAANEAIVDGDVALSDYDGVLWLVGEESTQDRTFDVDEQALVRAYVASGGAFVASGSEIGWDLDHLGSDADRAFVRDVLGGRYFADSAATFLVEPAEAAFARLDDASFLLPGSMMVWYPDVLTPGPRARAALSYAGGTGGAAMIRRDDARVVWAGFPIEAIDDPSDRRALLDALRRALDLD
jgi:D-alanyl-D-alanine carboxypeptidase